MNADEYDDDKPTVGKTPMAEWHSDRADIVEQQLNPSRTIAEVKAVLLGTTFAQNEKGEWMIGLPDPEKRVFTDEGVNAISSYLEPLLSSQVVLSNLQPNEPKQFALAFANNIARNMTVNWKKWFVKRYAQDPPSIEPVHDRVKYTLTVAVYAHLTRAVGGATHQGIVDMSKRIEHSQVIQREEIPEARGWMNKMKMGLK